MYNHQSRFSATANVTSRVRGGTVWIHDGWSGLNDLTNSEPAISNEAAALFPFSTGQAAYDAFVEVSSV